MRKVKWKRENPVFYPQSRPKVVGTLELYHVSPFPSNLPVGKHPVFFPTKREQITLLSTLKVGGGEYLLRVPTLLSGIAGAKPEIVGVGAEEGGGGGGTNIASANFN